jgi:trimeric autotransporter adhesin
VITDNSGQLSSSYPSGNQWFLNGAAITGASGTNFTPQQTGSYTVQSSDGACVTSMSQPIEMVVGNLGVIAYPNPVTDHLTLLNTQDRDLLVTIVSFNGNTVYSGKFQTYSMTISTGQLAAGQYVVYLVDAGTNEKKSFNFVKL